MRLNGLPHCNTTATPLQHHAPKQGRFSSLLDRLSASESGERGFKSRYDREKQGPKVHVLLDTCHVARGEPRGSLLRSRRDSLNELENIYFVGCIALPTELLRLRDSVQ